MVTVVSAICPYSWYILKLICLLLGQNIAPVPDQGSSAPGRAVAGPSISPQQTSQRDSPRRASPPAIAPSAPNGGTAMELFARPQHSQAPYGGIPVRLSPSPPPRPQTPHPGTMGILVDPSPSLSQHSQTSDSWIFVEPPSSPLQHTILQPGSSSLSGKPQSLRFNATTNNNLVHMKVAPRGLIFLITLAQASPTFGIS